VNDLLSSDPQKFDDLQIVAKAHLPIQQTNECDIIVFRSDDSVNEYFCLLNSISLLILSYTKKASIIFIGIRISVIFLAFIL